MQPCWQAGERLASLSIDNILLSERLSKYWKNVCHPTDIPYALCREALDASKEAGHCMQPDDVVVLYL